MTLDRRIAVTAVALVMIARTLVFAGDERPRPILREDLANRVFTLAEDASFLKKGGASEKYLFADDTSTLWLFRPLPDHEAYAEEAAWRLAARCGLRAAEVYAVSFQRPDGEVVTGTLGHILDDVKGGLGKLPVASLTDEQVAQLQELQVFRWLIADFDTHGDNFLLDGAGNVVTIDHSMAFHESSFFAFELDSAQPYKPVSIYDAFFKAAAAGRIRLDPKRPFAFIDAISLVPDKTIDAIVRPYARMRLQALGAVLKGRRGERVFDTEDSFVSCIQSRLHNLRDGFERFYRKLYRASELGEFAAPDPKTLRPPRTDESVDAWPAVTGLQTIRFTDSEDTFAKEKRLKRRQLGRHNRMMANFTDPYMRERFILFGIEKAARSVEMFLTRQAASEVKDLDLETLVLDDTLRAGLLKAPKDVLRALRERAAFAADHEDASGTVKENAKTLRLWIDQARAKRNDHGFGQNPAAP